MFKRYKLRFCYIKLGYYIKPRTTSKLRLLVGSISRALTALIVVRPLMAKPIILAEVLIS